jgi:hypothetical protein
MIEFNQVLYMHWLQKRVSLLMQAKNPKPPSIPFYSTEQLSRPAATLVISEARISLSRPSRPYTPMGPRINRVKPLKYTGLAQVIPSINENKEETVTMRPPSSPLRTEIPRNRSSRIRQDKDHVSKSRILKQILEACELYSGSSFKDVCIGLAKWIQDEDIENPDLMLKVVKNDDWRSKIIESKNTAVFKDWLSNWLLVTDSVGGSITATCLSYSLLSDQEQFEKGFQRCVELFDCKGLLYSESFTDALVGSLERCINENSSTSYDLTISIITIIRKYTEIQNCCTHLSTASFGKLIYMIIAPIVNDSAEQQVFKCYENKAYALCKVLEILYNLGHSQKFQHVLVMQESGNSIITALGQLLNSKSIYRSEVDLVKMVFKVFRYCLFTIVS